ncbi:MAG: glutamate--tRNA ligase, partial [Oscillospiraceae bacterium]|nr:glutamate--tRNA ligase [Oscillospiraceae bacterium]
RQKIPKDGETSFDDVVFGTITVPHASASLDEGVLLKSDGLPTYNFANIVDDHLMGITHVVRGSEYLSSMPKYVLMYKSFGWEMPEYVTVSQVMRDATHKLSKRAGDPTYEDLLAEGFLPEAILNYVALLGWSPGGEREFYTLPELCDAFEISGISKSPALFDKVKLTYFNAHYIRELSQEKFAELAKPRVDSESPLTKERAEVIAKLLQPRVETLADIENEEKIHLRFFKELPEYDLSLFVNKKSKTDEQISLDILNTLLPELERVETWDEPTLSALLSGIVESKGIKTGTLFSPLRIAVSGEAVTPGGPIEICAILGKAESIRRVKLAIGRLTK